MTILVTGGDGYIGWPTALRIATETNERVVAVDNGSRREWVEEMGAVSATPIGTMEARISAAEETHGVDNLSYVEGDLTDRSFVLRLLSVHEPSVVVHAAAQPSAPYSQIDGERANFTQHNNMQATRNLLFGLEERGLTDTHFIETTTTGIYGSPAFPIPEGGAVMENAGERDDVPFPGMGGSWYHQCYDAETEILTRAGWEKFPELSGAAEVMAMDADTGAVGWTRPTELQSYSYEGPMVTVSSERVSLKVTPNHRMLVGDAPASNAEEAFESRRRVIEAVELGTRVADPYMFTAFPEWDGEELATFELPACEVESAGGATLQLAPREMAMEPWLELFGWWLTAGSVESSTDGAVVRLEGRDDVDVTALASALDVEIDTLSAHNTATEQGYEVRDRQLASYLSRFEANRHVPAKLRNLDSERLRRLLDALVGGIEGADAGRCSYVCSNPRLAESIQEIALKLGYSARVGAGPASEPTDSTDGPTTVDIGSDWCVQPNADGNAFGTESYDGSVYCCTVEGGIVIVRRHGAPVWSGNSKSHDAANLRLAHGQFGLQTSDVRTAIVYGTETAETREDPRLKTRFDFDYYFGVVAHRFAAQAVAGYPLTIYGKGEQRKPFVSLEDCVEGLTRLALDETADVESHRVYNQVTRPIAIVEMAETIREVGEELGLTVDLTHVENPRDEDETHKMEIENDRYLDLIGGQHQSFTDGVRDIMDTLIDNEATVESHTDRFLPPVLTEESE
jgi:nucleoside-diphosphate-sugar epimerase